MPAPYEGRDVVLAHRGEGKFPEALGGQPVGAYGGGAGGEQPAVAGEGADQAEEPVAGAVPVGGGDLVQAVDEDQAAAGVQHPFGPAFRRGERAAHGGEEGRGGGQGTRPGQCAQRQDVRDPVPVPRGGHRQPLHQRRLAGARVAAQQYPVAGAQGVLGGEADGALGVGVLTRERRGPFLLRGRLQAQVGNLQRPSVGRVAQVDAIDGDAVVLFGDVRPVPALERRVPGVRPGYAADQLVDLRDQLGLAAGLLHQRPCHEGGAPGEELQDVQAGPLGRRVEEVAGVGGEPVSGTGRLPPQPGGQLTVSKAHRLDVVHVQVAEGEEPRGQGVGHGLGLVAREGRLAGRVQGGSDQLPGESPYLPLAQRAPLAPEGHQTVQPDRSVDQSGAGAARHEQLLHQRGDQTGRQLPAEHRRFHAPPPWSVDEGSITTVRTTGRRSPGA